MIPTRKSRTPGKRRYGRWLVGLTVLMIASIAIVLGLSRDRVPLLLAHATRIVPMEESNEWEFAWLPNDAYVFYSKSRHAFCRYQLSSGICTALTAPSNTEPWGGKLQASPDGKWLFWFKDTHSEWSGRPVFTCLDDGRSYEAEDVDQGQWASNSQYFLGQRLPWENIDQRAVMVFDTSARRFRQAIPTKSDAVLDGSHTVLIAPDRVLEVVSEGAPNSHIKDQPVALYDYRLDKTLHLKRTWLVTPPHDTTMDEVKLSPGGDKIAWLVDTTYVSPALAFLHRLLPFVPAPAQRRQGLWISRLDGTGMQVIGEIPLKVRNGESLSADDLRWLPDGKHLSLSYDNALWTVSAQQ